MKRPLGPDELPDPWPDDDPDGVAAIRRAEQARDDADNDLVDRWRDCDA